MPNPVMRTNNFPALLSKDYRKIFFDEYTRYEPEYDKLARISTQTEGNFVKEGDLVGLSSLVEKTQGDAVTFNGFIPGYEKTVYFTTLALGLQVTEEMWDDDLTGHIKKLNAELGKAAAYSRELKFWDILNQGFNATYHTGWDAAGLFTASHPYKDGSGNQSNLQTGSLSRTTLEAAMTLLENQKNERGIPLNMRKNLVLVIPSSLRWKAKELSLSELQPDTANNAVNTVKGEFEYVVGHYLSSTTAWFVASKTEHDLRCIWRKPLAYKSNDDFMTGNTLAKASMRGAWEFWNWRGIVGSAGT